MQLDTVLSVLLFGLVLLLSVFSFSATRWALSNYTLFLTSLHY